MARWLRGAVPRAAGLAVLLLAAATCTYEAGLAILRPLDASGQPAQQDAHRERRADPRDPQPRRFQPQALVTNPLFAIHRTVARPAPPAPETPSLPIPEPIAPAAQLDIAPPDYTLAGVIISETERKVLLRKHKGERGRWIARGKTTSDGWLILTVDPEKIILARSESQFKLWMYPYHNVK